MNYVNSSCLALFLTKAVAVPIPTWCQRAKSATEVFDVGIMPSCHHAIAGEKRQEFDFLAVGAERPPLNPSLWSNFQQNFQQQSWWNMIGCTVGPDTTGLSSKQSLRRRPAALQVTWDSRKLKAHVCQTLSYYHQGSTGHGHSLPTAAMLGTFAAKRHRPQKVEESST